MMYKCHLFSLQEINHFRKNFFESTYWRSPSFSILETQYLILETQNSSHSNFEKRELSFEDRVETVNLLLSNIVQHKLSFTKH